MDLLVGEGLKKSNKAGSAIDFAEITKQFQYMGSGKPEKVDFKLVGDLFSGAKRLRWAAQRTGLCTTCRKAQDCRRFSQ